MCGIVGYVGYRSAQDVLLGGLSRLEYRGYDSAGIAVKSLSGAASSAIEVSKKAGKLAVLARELEDSPLKGCIGIGHTRWATHGLPNDANAHPHATEDGRLVIIHNGIIENYLSLKEGLLARGHVFRSETDSEVLAHLIEETYRGDLEKAVRDALSQVRGAYGIVVTHADHDIIVAARTVSPLVMGIGEGEMFLGSDVPALLPYTRNMVFLHDGDMAVLSQDGYHITNLAGVEQAREVTYIDWDAEAAEKGGFDTFMLKEIYEQPTALTNTLMGRLHDETGEVVLDIALEPASFERIHIVACGTAFYAGLVGEYLIEQLARVPVEVDVASEYRYREPLVDDKTLVIVVSQSGETIDTLEALREAKKSGAKTLGVINAKGSSMTREVDDVLYIHAGPEIGVASTKAYTAMVSAMLLLALWLGRARGTLDALKGAELLRGVRELPRLVEESLSLERVAHIKRVAEKYKDARDYLFLGRGVNAPTALTNTLMGRLHDETGEVVLDIALEPASFERIHIVACGTAFYAGLVGEYLIEQLARVPVEVDVASEYRYREPLVDDKTLVIVVSQSGETIDTLEALREAKKSGAKTLGVINAKGSSMTREVDDVLYIHAGPEIGVASTKAYTAMVSAMLLLGLWLGRARGTLDAAMGAELLRGVRELPRLVEESLSLERTSHIKRVAEKYKDARDYLFLGRGVNAPTALEGALKLKEISYIHAEGYASGEMKHGPIALIDSSLPVVVVATESRLLEKTVSAIQEVKARSGRVIALVTDGDAMASRHADDLISVPRAHEMVSPIVNVVALQLLAYYTATALERDVDKPRNLAKSVTVE